MINMHASYGYHIIVAAAMSVSSHKFCVTTLLLMTIQNQQAGIWGSLQQRNVHMRFSQNPFSSSKIETDMTRG
jgi:hypothetical protein